MKVYKAEDKNALREAAEMLRQGELVAFPTETVYGLGANGLDPLAVSKIYKAKGRPSDNPLILHIYDIKQLEVLTSEISPLAHRVIDKFWPGPITLILPKADCVPDCVTAGLDTVAIRMPSNETARHLLRLSKVPVAAPSANLSGKPSGTMLKHIVDDFEGKIDAVVDGGSCEVGLESTVLDLSGEKPIILRPGAITKEMLEKELGVEVLMGGSVVDLKEVPKAPGMKYRHYAPKGKVIICKKANLLQEINQNLAESKGVVGLMLSKDTMDKLGDKANNYLNFCLGNSEEEIAKNLFRALRFFDDNVADVIISEEFANVELFTAVMNRLNKAAGEVK